MARNSYAFALRCIGQDLDRRGIKCFEIRCAGRAFIVEGGYQEPPAQTPVTIYYRPADIDELDEAGAEKRNQSPPTPDFLSKAQVFRTIGGYLDKAEATLICITNNESGAAENSLKVEYMSRDRENVINRHTGADIYGMCVTMYKQRGKLTGTGGRLARWRR